MLAEEEANKNAEFAFGVAQEESLTSMRFDLAHNVIGKYLTEIKKLNQSHPEIDAMALENRIWMLSHGLMNMDPMPGYSAYNRLKQENAVMVNNYSHLQMHMGAGYELVDSTRSQWKKCFTDNVSWLGNCCDRDGEFRDDVVACRDPENKRYRMHMLILLGFKKKIQAVQERRKMIMT